MLNLRKKLLVSIFTLMLALVAVSTTTYAWFTLGNVTDVKGMEMSVQGADGLEIRVEKINGVTVATNETLKSLYNWSTSLDLTGKLTGDYKITLLPLTMTNLVNGDLKPIAGINDDSTANYGSLVEVGQRRYLEITFGFKTLATASHSVIIKDLSSTPNKDTHSFETSVQINEVGSLVEAVNSEGVIAANTILTEVRAANAMRIAYYDDTDDTYVVCNPSEYTAAIQCGEWGGAALEYFNAIDQSVDGEGNPLTLNAPAPYTGITDVEHDGTKLVELEWKDTYQYSYAQLTIRVWLEGWDADCFNAVAFDTVKFDVQFGTKENA